MKISPETKPAALRLEIPLILALDAIADAENISRAGLMRLYIAEGIERATKPAAASAATTGGAP